MLYSSVQHRWTRIILAVVGSFIYSVGINYFVTPAGLYTGGFLGVGQIIRTLLVQDLGLTFGGLEHPCLSDRIPIHIGAFRRAFAVVYGAQYGVPQHPDSAGGADPL